METSEPPLAAGWRRVIFAAALIVSAVPLPAAVHVGQLRCDAAVDPVGIDSEPPQLSWQLASEDRGERQTSWQVQAASSRDRLLAGDADLWDSGSVAGEAQLQVPYRGRSLHTGQTAFWRVRVGDASGQLSPWSAPATWTCGVVAAGDWHARWITDPVWLRTVRPKLGFSTPPTTEERTPAWIVIDLGQACPIDEIVLDAVVHTVGERLGFPVEFLLEVASTPDFAGATVVADSRAPKHVTPWETRVKVVVPRVSAQFVRLSVPRLRMTEEEGLGVVGRLALQQIEVRSGGRNVAVGAKVSASTSLEQGPWSAAAVVDGKDIPGENPHSAQTLQLRREFAARPAVKRALLFVTGLGSYTVAVNGVEVAADELLKPAWSNAARTCFYDTRDVTALIRTGANALGLTLAGGMYQVPSIPGRYTKFVTATRAPVAFAQLQLEYADGSSETIVTDETWKVAPGPTVFAHVYGGEDFDARRQTHGWDLPGFDDSAWRAAAVAPAPGGVLRGISFAAPPIKADSTLSPLRRSELRPGVSVIDFGQNASVMPRLRVHGAAGSKVKITPAELLNADGSIDPRSTRPSDADASWSYTLAGGGEAENWQPHFFYSGARYFQVECVGPAGAAAPVIDQIEAIVVHADAPAAGSFACSNELFNRIATLIRWAQLSNLSHVITDCPHRERLGWLEQCHLNGPALRYDFDLTRQFVKCFGDIADAQRPSGLVPDIAPEFIQFEGGFRDSPEWGSTVILAAWQQYVWTGDKASLRSHYGEMRRYFDYLSTRASSNVLSYGLGDWYDVGPKPPGFAQLTPVALTATAIYYEDAVALGRIATVLGDAAAATEFARHAAEIGTAFNARFFDSARATYATGSQTANAMPLVLGLVPDAARAAVVSRLVEDVRAHGNGLTAGDVGYRYLLRALADGGRSDVVYEINNQCEKPGYGYQLAHGATSLTEAWNADRSSSQNHFMLGQIIEWLFGDVAGLAPDPEKPGFGGVIVRPQPVGDLTWAKATYDSVRGPIAVSWRKHEDGRFELEVAVPPNATAQVELPTAANTPITESGVSVDSAPGVRRVLPENDRPTFAIGSGRYVFTFPITASVTAAFAPRNDR